MRAQGCLVLAGYAAIVVSVGPWGLMAVAAHALILLATVRR